MQLYTYPQVIKAQKTRKTPQVYIGRWQGWIRRFDILFDIQSHSLCLTIPCNLQHMQYSDQLHMARLKQQWTIQIHAYKIPHQPSELR